MNILHFREKWWSKWEYKRMGDFIKTFLRGIIAYKRIIKWWEFLFLKIIIRHLRRIRNI